VIFCLRKYAVASSIIRKHLDSRSGRRNDLEIAPLRQQMLAPDWDQVQVRFRGRHRIVEDALPSSAMNSIMSGGPAYGTACLGLEVKINVRQSGQRESQQFLVNDPEMHLTDTLRPSAISREGGTLGLLAPVGVPWPRHSSLKVNQAHGLGRSRSVL
jgi:hypothetical protein